MDTPHLTTLLELSGAVTDGPWSVLPNERTVTLHVARAGALLNIARIERLRQQGDLLLAQNSRGETFVIVLADVFAGTVDAEKKVARKAGFV